MEKKEAKPKQDVVNMPLIHARAAGIDVGDTFHVAAIPEGIFAERVKDLAA